MAFGVAFSALNIAAWNWDFPSPFERTLWHVASLSATISCSAVALLLPFLGTGSKRWQYWTVILIALPLQGLFMLARAVIMVQVILSLRLMPEGVYQNVSWTSYLPHFG